MQLYIAIGKVYKEPISGESERGLAFSRFSIAVPKQGRGKTVDYFTVVAWGKMAERVAKLSKGDEIAVKGEFHSNSYTNKDGKKQYVVDLTVNDIEPLGEKPKVEDATPIAEDIDENLPF